MLPLINGALEFADGHYAEALEELTRLEPGAATRKPALLLIGQSLMGLGRPIEAANVFRQLIELDSGFLPARYALSRYWYDRGSVAQARYELDQITRIDARQWRAWRELGGHSFDFSRYAEAVRYFEQALALDLPPEERQQVLLELAQSHFFRREYAQAVERFDQATPTPLSESLKAEALASLGRHDESQSALAHATTLDPSDRTVRLVTARLAIQDGKPESALDPLLQQLEVNPHDRECRFQLSQAYSALGRTDEAAAEREKFAELDRLFDQYTDLSTRVTAEPGNIPLREQLAELCAQLGQHSQAASWRRAVQILRQEQASSEPDVDSHPREAKDDGSEPAPHTTVPSPR
ncbi:MAG: tetratricopeptide repeat protein [Planctomycetaceae bacterium]